MNPYESWMRLKDMKAAFCVVCLSLGSTAALLTGCSLAPSGTKDEVARAQVAGAMYERPKGERPLPELPEEPGWQEVLQRAFLANGDLEASYWEWRAALARVEMASAYPNSNVQVGYEYMFTRESMKAWNRSTVSASFDPSMPLQLPMKVQQAGKVALEQARAAGMRFEAAKFDLQKKVLTAWLDYALMAEKVRIQQDTVRLLDMLVETAEDRVKTGGPQQDLIKAQMEYRLAQNELAGMEADLGRMRAMLNGMLARPADAALTPPRQLPEARQVEAEDAALIQAAVDQNPELGALARDVAGRSDAVELARMKWIPDLNFSGSVTGDVSKTIGAMAMLPTNVPMINGQIKEAKAMLRATEAMMRQTSSDRAAAFVAALAAMRNAERQTRVFEEGILPKARQAMGASRDAYAAGQVSFIEVVDSQRTLLAVRQVIAEMRMEREKRLAEMETLAGVDVETLARRPGSMSQPAQRQEQSSRRPEQAASMPGAMQHE